MKRPVIVRKHLLITVIFALLAAPSWAWKTKKNLEEKLQAMIGKDADDIVRYWHPPTSSYIYKDGSKDLFFHFGSTISTVSPVYGLYYGPRPVNNLNFYCDITLKAGPDNKITTWTMKGNNCRSDKAKVHTQ